MSLESDNASLAQPVLDLGLTFFIVVTLFVVGLLAGVLPAIRASRIDPAESLRAL
jgi:ABC-type antimicrobial peptide transport system permease subunit